MYALVAVAAAVLSLEPPHVTPLWPMVVLGLCGLTVLLVHRRYPRLAFAGAVVLAVLSLATGSGAESLLAVLAVHAAGVRRSARGAWLALGVALVCGGLAALAVGVRSRTGPPVLGLAPPVSPRDSLLDWLNVFAVVAVVLLVATLLGLDRGHRRRHVAELVDRAERLARERDQQAEIARALERERIAREMHDVIAHSLSVMIAISDGAHAAADERPAESKEAIARVAETGRRTLGEVRRLLGTVRGEDGRVAVEHGPQPDASQLTSLAAEFVAAGLPVRLVVTGTPSQDPALGLTVYRIVQESLTNVLRHARRVRSATVAVTWTADDVTVLVRDTGSAVPPSSRPGRGILGMRERVALYDGTVEAGPGEDGGWRVLARLRQGER
ncbi:sensor histidine kinase [Auraticoccus monumenti]|uniref:histidine kinase n=1 Tax=Auraticoccus monumenti TaxID=675864 RepID=A0A1G7AK15_9ACTN|nr:histidine kinase [Auraticoccus monumenti]SDE15132.1 Histidine kinase [Auraticoccus monumenti]